MVDSLATPCPHLFLFSGSVTAATRVVIVSVVHFSSEWQEPFDAGTEEANFTTADGRSVTVDMMTGEKRLNYESDGPDGAEVVAVPFADPGQFMVVVMPKEGSGEEKKLIGQKCGISK